MCGVTSILPPIASKDSDVDPHFSGQDKVANVAVLKGEDHDGVYGCTFDF